MRRELLKLQRLIIDGPDEGCAPFDKGAYTSFAWSLQDLSYSASSEDEKALCLFLHDLANKKAQQENMMSRTAGQLVRILQDNMGFL